MYMDRARSELSAANLPNAEFSVITCAMYLIKYIIFKDVNDNKDMCLPCI